MLYLVCGLPGTGKTKVAKELSSIAGGVALRTDELRKQILSSPQYTPEEKEKVYGALFRTAESMLAAGATVIIDATFHKKRERDIAKEIAKKTKNKLLIIEVKCNEEIVLKRLEKRKNELSDADTKVYRQIKGEWEPLEERHAVVDTSGRNWKKTLKEIVEK